MKSKVIVAAMAMMGICWNANAIELKECRIGSENSIRTIKAECGTLSVPENRSNPSRMIDLNVAVVRTRSSEKEADPVIMLAGGPGQSAIETYPQTHGAFSNIRKNRDIVLVDQRGTGKSNKISCDFDEEAMMNILTDENILFKELEKCVSNLDADTRYYTTPESIKDLEEVRKALKIEQWNLIGISYGTRKALTYMKMFPESLRSVILDGVVPQQEPLAQSHERNLVDALRKQFEYCKNEEACNEEFGNVESKLWQLFKQLEEDPPEISVANPTTGEVEKITFSKDIAAVAIRLFSYSPTTMRLLPLLIEKANNGDLNSLASQSMMIGSMLQEGLSNVEMSILCAEDAPFYQIDDVSDNNVFGKRFLARTQKSCEYWPHIDEDYSFKDPVVSDIPTLLLSGELDPVTPPRFADIAMETLSNSQHLVAKGQGHNVFPQGCMPKIISKFYADPNEELDTECMENFNYEPFFINMLGPKQ